MGRNKKDDVERMEEMRLKTINAGIAILLVYIFLVAVAIGVNH